MSTHCLQSIGDNIYLWELVCKSSPLPQHLQSRIAAINEKLLEKFFSTKRGDTESLLDECSKYFTEVKKMLPNFTCDFSTFSGSIEQEFYMYNSELLTLQAEKAQFLIKEVKASYKFEEIVPRVFFKDLDLQIEELRFLTKMFVVTSFNEKVLMTGFVDTFKEFIHGFDENAKVFIDMAVNRLIEDFRNSCETNANYAKNKLTDYLTSIFNNLEYTKLEIYNQLLLESDDHEEQWVLISSIVLVDEPISLNQVVKLDSTRLLITISLETSKEIMLFEFKDFIVTRLPQFLKYKIAYFARGSMAEDLIIIINDTRECYKAILLESGVKLLDKISLFGTRQEKIVSACYIKHEGKVICVYQSGEIEQFSLTKSPPISFSNILPQIYSDIFISECERFVFLVSESKVSMFDSKLNIIDLQNFRPVFIQIIENSAVFVYMDEELFSFASLKIDSSYLARSPKRRLTYNHVVAESTRTFELGVSLFRDFTAPKNEFLSSSAANKKK